MSGGYHEGGVELVLPILVKVSVTYNGFSIWVTRLSNILPLEGKEVHDLTELNY